MGQYIAPCSPFSENQSRPQGLPLRDDGIVFLLSDPILFLKNDIRSDPVLV